MSDRKLLIENAIAEIDRNATDRQREAGELYLRALSGDMKARHTLSEGISTSDVPALLAPAINVQFLAQYADFPVVWNQIVGDTINATTLGGIEFGGFEFDSSALLGEHDGDTYVGMGLPGVGEYGEFPALSYATEQLEAELRKNGIRLRISWEALIKLGNFDIIGRATRQFARYAAEQEDVALAKQFVSTAGVINSDFTTITGSPALSLAALETAVGQASATTVGGRPLGATGFNLVVPPSLSQTAANILSITQVERTVGGDTYIQSTNTGNVRSTVFNALAQVGNYTTPGAVNDNWFLVADGTARPAFAEVFLEGYRQPSISIKDSGSFTLSGGVVPAREGSFEIEDVEVKGRHVVQAVVVEPAAVFASDGA